MTTRTSIVVALDLSEYSEIVLEHALDQAVRHSDPDLHFLTVVDAHADVEDTKSRLAALVIEGLDDFDCAGWRARLHVRAGPAAEEITALAAEIRAHLIVVGRFGVHHTRRRIGTVAHRVIEAATCPTLVVGLNDQSPDHDQCPDCTRVRAESDGERWFCVAHSGPDRERLATALVHGPTWTTSGLMW